MYSHSDLTSEDRLAAQTPTLLFVIGYFLFYSQFLLKWWNPQGPTSQTLLTIISALLLAGAGVTAGILTYRFAIKTWREMPLPRLFLLLLLPLLIIFGLNLYSGLKPAHLVQERDFMQYHLLLSRFPWLVYQWNGIENFIFEFRLLGIQYGLSFLWVGLPLLNKLPQVLVIWFLCLQIWIFFTPFRLAQPFQTGLIALSFFLTSRGVQIQLGMATLDLVNLYFVVAALCGVIWLTRSPNPTWARVHSVLIGINLAAYLVHKSFGFIWLAAILGLFIALTRAWPKLTTIHWKYAIAPILLIAIPNFARSFYFTGDPFFPIFPRMSQLFCDNRHLTLMSCSQVYSWAESTQHGVFSDYGIGYGFLNAVKAFFLLAVPETGKSINKFDYPLGLTWYCGWGLLVASIWLGRKNRLQKKVTLSVLAAALFGYALWFLGSHQARWLYPVMLLLSLHAGYFIKRLPLVAIRIAVVLLMAGQLLTGLRIYRGQRWTWPCFGEKCLEVAYNPVFLKDYRTTCPTNGEWMNISSENMRDRGYLSCRLRIVPEPSKPNLKRQ